MIRWGLLVLASIVVLSISAPVEARDAGCYALADASSGNTIRFGGGSIELVPRNGQAIRAAVTHTTSSPAGVALSHESRDLQMAVVASWRTGQVRAFAVMRGPGARRSYTLRTRATRSQTTTCPQPARPSRTATRTPTSGPPRPTATSTPRREPTATTTPPPTATCTPTPVPTLSPTATSTPAPTLPPTNALTARGPLRLSATFSSIGVELLFAGDDNANAAAALNFRRAGDAQWREGLPLWRTGAAAAPGRAFYGSALLLEPGQSYEIRVTLTDPDGVVGSAQLSATVATRAETIAPATSLQPSHYVSASGDDAADGTSPGTAWRTLEKAVAAAPNGAVVQVGPGYFPAPTSARSLPLTLVAQFPAVADDRTLLNGDRRSVITSGLGSAPSGAFEPGLATAPWERVTLAGPGFGGAPAGATYSIWKWAGVPTAPTWLGYASTRSDAPQRIASWALKGNDLQTPAGFTEKLYRNQTYSYGWGAFPDGNGAFDVYARLPGDRDPNTLYVTAGGSAGIEVNGPDVRLSGFEVRPFSYGVALDDAAQRAVVDHNLIEVGYAGVRLQGDKGASPNRYGTDSVVERNVIVDSGLWSVDPGSPAIPWLFIKGGIYNPDGAAYPQGRIGEPNETAGVFFRGGGQRLVVRNNTIDGPFNGFTAYNADYDRYATQDTDVSGNLVRHIADDAFEPEQVGINWRIWNNRVEQTSTVLSTGPLSFGPIYLVRNEAWRTGKAGVGLTNRGEVGVGPLFFKYSGQSNPPARIFVINNTLWTDEPSVDGAAQYAGGGRSAEAFFLRNNVIRATRYAFQYGAWDEQANSVSTSDTTRGLDVNGHRWGGDVAAYRASLGRSNGTNVGWDPVTNLGSFTSPPDAWLRDAAAGDLSLADGSPFVDGGVPVPNVVDRPGVDYGGSAPDLGAREKG